MKNNRRFLLIIFLIVIAVASAGCWTGEEPLDAFLTLDIVADAFRSEGLRLDVNEAMEPDEFKKNGISPTIYSLDKTDDNLLIYIFDDYVEEEFEDLGRPRLSFGKVVFPARNALVVYLPHTIPEIANQTSVEEGREDIFWEEIERLAKTSNAISDVVFKKLNDGKVAIYVGESQNWQARITVKYWQHDWVNQEGTHKFSGKYLQYHEIQYFGNDIDQVGSVSYEYEGPGNSGSASGLTLDRRGYSSAGSSGSTGWIFRGPDKDFYRVKIKWKGQEETLVAKPWEPKAVVQFQ